MIINLPAIDYFRATTFERTLFLDVSKLVIAWAREQNIEQSRGGIMQYKGDRYDGIFLGQGEQAGRTHYIIDVSGSESDALFPILRNINRGWKVKRIDLQYTAEKHADYSARSLLDCLENGIWLGRRPAIKAIINGGNDTLYLGSRTSGAFTRIYVKHDDWLRYEIEYKADYAAALFLALNEDTDYRTVIAAALYERAERMPCSIKAIHYRLLQLVVRPGEWKLQVEKVEPEKIKKLRWLASLLNTIQALANDHDYGHTVRQWLIEIVRNAENE